MSWSDWDSTRAYEVAVGRAGQERPGLGRRSSQEGGSRAWGPKVGLCTRMWLQLSLGQQEFEASPFSFKKNFSHSSCFSNLRNIPGSVSQARAW